MNKRRLLRLLAAVSAAVLLASCANPGAANTVSSANASNTADTGDIDHTGEASPTGTDAGLDEAPVSRAMAAKMLALAYSDNASIGAMDRTITFTDTSAELWYDRYINAAVSMGLMSGAVDGFLPEEYLTVEQAQTLLDSIDPNNAVKMRLTDENRDMPISGALWTELYLGLLESLSGDAGMESYFSVDRREIIVLLTRANNADLPEGCLVADNGPFTCAGMDFSAYIDKAVYVLAKDGEIIAFMGVAEDEPTIANAYISAVSGDTITIFSGGAERTYYYDASAVGVGGVCDITINGDTARNVYIYGERITGVIKSASAAGVELEEYGLIPCADDVKVYSVADGTVRWRYLKSLLSGTDMAEFVMKGGSVCAAIVIKSVLPDNLRVLIGTTGFGGYVHGSVEISSSGAFTIRAGSETLEYAAGDSVVFSTMENYDLFGQDRIYIYPEEGGKLAIGSIERAWGAGVSPRYRGVIEVSKRDGGFCIVNEIGMDEYLYAVIPSEMPTSHGLQAAKIQAVISRSYAYNQFYSNRFYQYGAHVDDSVSCQVYNNTPETDIAIQAANETTGQCLSYGGEIISAYFFSTSAGVTSNSGDVWGDSSTKAFPVETPAYFSSVKQYEGDYGDLSDDGNMRTFITDASVQSYDSAFPWFRWSVTMTAEELANSINSSMSTRHAVNPGMIKTLSDSGMYLSAEPGETGRLLGLKVASRAESGLVMELEALCENGTYLIRTEYNIRTLLKPVQLAEGGEPIRVYRHDGTYVADYNMLPSAYFVFDETLDAEGNLLSVTFYGGGCGHGVGMSQNGVKAMLDIGYTMDEIFAAYFTGAKIASYK